MNNAILFFYGINVSNVKKINSNYYFNYLNSNYGVYSYNRDLTDSIFLYNLNLELLNRGVFGYEIVLTNNNSVLFSLEDKWYILMKFPSINNRFVTFEDIINFNYEVDSSKYKKLDKSNWGVLWSNKIDFIEYQFFNMKEKYPLISDNIDYYIGLWENAISYYNDNVFDNKKRFICHKRVSVNMDLYEFLNPLNFIVDYKERDISSYIKSYVINKNFSYSFIDKFLSNINREGLILIISRILFPSYFFDIYEKIIVDKYDEKELLNVIDRDKNITGLIKYIFNRYSYFNIPYINWIKKD